MLFGHSYSWGQVQEMCAVWEVSCSMNIPFVFIQVWWLKGNVGRVWMSSCDKILVPWFSPVPLLQSSGQRDKTSVSSILQIIVVLMLLSLTFRKDSCPLACPLNPEPASEVQYEICWKMRCSIMRNIVTGAGISHILILTGLCEERLFQYCEAAAPHDVVCHYRDSHTGWCFNTLSPLLRK